LCGKTHQVITPELVSPREKVGRQGRFPRAGRPDDQDIPETDADSRSMQENRIRRGQQILGGAPFQEGEDLFQRGGIERRPARCERGPGSCLTFDAIA
jgi:hypothetical protein